jgi:sugar phosphate isomerase/epimerase
VDELGEVFSDLPDAGFCFDVAHAWSVDPQMGAAEDLLDAFGDRLRQVHLSSLSNDLHHLPLSADDEFRFRPLLERCIDVPWILEAFDLATD